MNKSEHAIVYTTKQPPRPLPGESPAPDEAPLRSALIRVKPDDRTDKLSPTSRINFGKVYTIEHNTKVRNFGVVHRDSLKALQRTFQEVWFGTSEVHPSNPLPEVRTTAPPAQQAEAGPSFHMSQQADSSPQLQYREVHDFHDARQRGPELKAAASPAPQEGHVEQQSL